jgi:putative hydrolase of the HAD superfamily
VPTNGVVFDLFHTLVDPERWRPTEFDRLAEAAAALGVEAAEVREHWEQIVETVVTTPARPAELLAEHARSLGADVTADRVAAVDDALGRYQDLALLGPIPGVVATLGLLRDRGLRLGLLSNAHERDVRSWGRSPLAGCFDATILSCHAGVMKPDPAAYAAVLDSMNVPAARAVFVGDGNGGELVGAREAGFEMVVVVTGPALRSGLRSEEEMARIAEDADVEIEDVAALPDLLFPG